MSSILLAVKVNLVVHGRGRAALGDVHIHVQRFVLLEEVLDTNIHGRHGVISCLLTAASRAQRVVTKNNLANQK